VVEQFASVVLGVADRAAIMVNGKIKAIGRPEALEDQLQVAYLGGVS
jgi:branched-chain amino acid transport system ATP-binding protein